MSRHGLLNFRFGQPAHCRLVPGICSLTGRAGALGNRQTAATSAEQKQADFGGVGLRSAMSGGPGEDRKKQLASAFINALTRSRQIYMGVCVCMCPLHSLSKDGRMGMRGLVWRLAKRCGTERLSTCLRPVSLQDDLRQLKDESSTLSCKLQQ